MSRLHLFLAAAGLLAATSPAVAQTQAPESAATLDLRGGLAGGGRHTGALFGGAATFALTPRIAVEASGAWLDRGRAADGLSISAAVLVNLLEVTSTRLAPYVAVGAGLYRADFDLADPRFLGPIGPGFGAGAQFCPSPGHGPAGGTGPGFGSGSCPLGGNVGQWGVGEMPEFYARRLGALTVPPGGRWDSRSFTDPSIVVGGGVSFVPADHLEIRPDLRALIVIREGDTHVLGLVTVSVGYRF